MTEKFEALSPVPNILNLSAEPLSNDTIFLPTSSRFGKDQCNNFQPLEALPKPPAALLTDTTKSCPSPSNIAVLNTVTASAASNFNASFISIAIAVPVIAATMTGANVIKAGAIVARAGILMTANTAIGTTAAAAAVATPTPATDWKIISLNASSKTLSSQPDISP